ncbi:hypothetical protein ABPG77_006624 [Micractinium sp. CCAP 211/92]
MKGASQACPNARRFSLVHLALLLRNTRSLHPSIASAGCAQGQPEQHRVILASSQLFRPGVLALNPRHLGSALAMLDPEDWRCPTCLDLAYKPAVNSACGHVFCFWCLHKAMSPYAPSACPICRAQYTNLPAICPRLHHFLACQFPEAYAARREETEAEEEELGAKSPEPQASGLLPPPAAPGQWRPQHFACDAPRCGRLLCHPVVLICGHAVCQDCLPACSNGGGGHGTAASPAAGAGTCAQTSPGVAAAGALACPACGLAARQAPALCKQLADLLAELFPGESSQREAEAHAARAACAEHEADAQAAATASAAAATAESPSATSPEAAAPPTAAAAAAAGETSIRAYTQQHDGAASGSASPPGGQPASPAAWQSLSPSLTSALRRRQAEGGAGQAMAERMEQSLLRMTAGEEYAWHGVGCDGCGQYPIQGRRYKCLDCPEAIGFDLCGACMDQGLSDIVGRFNQRHTPQHRMRSMRPRITAIHMLKAANPELPMEQLMWLLEMAMAPEHDGGEGGETAGEEQQQSSQQSGQQQQGEQHQEGQRQQQQQQGEDEQSAEAAGTAGSSGLLPMLRRGPRPAYDPAAQEPSPAVYAPRPQRQAASQQAQDRGPAGAEAEGLIGDEPAVTEVHVPIERLLLRSSSGAGTTSSSRGGTTGPSQS